ncbi:MAG TPA: hypothetical protein VLD37_02330 [Candidatus Bilamarchaeum sp.]|nr:hypothetical protein [Candidatus Bilamarchaeum sp.]
MDFLQAYFLSLGIEACLLFAFFHMRYEGSAVLLNAVIATSITLPFVWFAFPLLGLPWAAQTALSEIFALVVEAGAYRGLFQRLAWKDAIAASALCNAASFVAGLAF